MSLDPKSLTIDYRTLLKNTSISDRVQLTKSQSGQQLLSILTPSQISDLFPDYYKRSNSDVSGFIEATTRRYKGISAGTQYNEEAGTGTKYGPSKLGYPAGAGVRQDRTGQVIDPVVSSVLQKAGIRYNPASQARLTREQQDIIEDLKRGNISADDPRVAFLGSVDERSREAAGIKTVTDSSGKSEYQYVPVREPSREELEKGIKKTGSDVKGYEESGMSRAEMASYIKEEAKKRGIDPEIALRVAYSEGMGGYQSSVINQRGQRERSYGPFQLYMGGGLGNEFQRDTGINPETDRSERSVKMGIQYALDRAARDKTWQPWHGAKNTRIPNTAGFGKDTQAIGTYEPTLALSLPANPTPKQLQDFKEKYIKQSEEERGQTLASAVVSKTEALPGISQRAWNQMTPGTKSDLIQAYNADPEGFAERMQKNTAVGAPDTELNLKRPDYWKGTITMEGREYPFGTGAPGATGEKWKGGSVPKGLFDIRPGLHSGQNPNYRQNSFYVEDMFDPKWGRKRVGVLFHSAEDLDNMYTAGCLGVSRDQWPQFRAHMLDMMKRNGPLQVHVDATGNATVFPKGNPPPELRREVAQTGQPINPSDFSASELRQGANNPGALQTPAAQQDQPAPATAATPAQQQTPTRAEIPAAARPRGITLQTPEQKAAPQQDQTAATPAVDQSQQESKRVPAVAEKKPQKEESRELTKKQQQLLTDYEEKIKTYVPKDQQETALKRVRKAIETGYKNPPSLKSQEEIEEHLEKQKQRQSAIETPAETTAAEEPIAKAARGKTIENVSSLNRLTKVPINPKENSGEDSRLLKDGKPVVDYNKKEKVSYDSNRNQLKITPEDLYRSKQETNKQTEQASENYIENVAASQNAQQNLNKKQSVPAPSWEYEKKLTPLAFYSTDAYKRVESTNEKFGFGRSYGYAGLNNISS